MLFFYPQKLNVVGTKNERTPYIVDKPVDMWITRLIFSFKKIIIKKK